MPKTEASWDPNGKGRMKLPNRWEKEHTSLKIATEKNSQELGIFVISKNATCMKCKNPCGTVGAPENHISIYLYIVMS